MAAHSELFVKACLDTKTAWKKTGLSSMLRREKVERLISALTVAGAQEIAHLLMEISYAPYSGAAANIGIDDGKAGRLSRLLMTAILIPYVQHRRQGEALDLAVLKTGLIAWIDHGTLPPAFHADACELTKITELIERPQARVSLTAPFAAPIEFSLQALAALHQGEERKYVENH